MKLVTRNHRNTKLRAIASSCVIVAGALLTIGLSGCKSSEEIETPPLIPTLNPAKTYTNPLALKEEWPGGTADPNILRFNGTYYLYATSARGIKAWSSEDLINWKYEDSVSKDPNANNVWDPGVTYYNGLFYMYPAVNNGDNHYLFTSESPLGPFTKQSDNFPQLKIDSNVFIDDDGKWYMVHAGGKGIIGRTMSDSLTIGPEKQLNAYLNAWTEGPSIFKRNGIYYMLYTGNHYLSKGYRVDYSVSKDGPIGKYTQHKDHTLLLSTKDDLNGLGNAMVTIGPDLDSYYVVYHNLVGKRPGSNAVVRKANIDRIVFNGELMSVNGPTHYHVEAPKMSDFYTWLDRTEGQGHFQKEAIGQGYRFTSKEASKENFIAEFTFKELVAADHGDSAWLGMLFSYHDKNQYAFLSIDPAAKTISLNQMSHGAEIRIGELVKLPADTDFTKLHTVRVEKNDGDVRIYFDGMKKVQSKLSVGGGSIGYVYEGVEPVFSYTAFSNDVYGSSDFEVFHTVPGTIQAVHFMKEENRGFFAQGADAVELPYRKGDKVHIRESGDGGYAADLKQSGDWLSYKVNVKESGLYGLDLAMGKLAKAAAVELFIDGKPVGKFDFPVQGDDLKEAWIKQTIGNVQLAQGFHQLTIKLVKGDITIRAMELFAASNEKAQMVNALGDLSKVTMHGKWNPVANGASSVISQEDKDVKLYIGHDGWTDYEIEADVTVKAPNHANGGGIVFRATNESQYPAQVQDSMTGYYLSILSNKLVLKKLNYGAEIVANANVKVEAGQSNKVKIRAQGNRIFVYWNDMLTPVIEYFDANAWTHGKIGLRSNVTGFEAANLKVQPRH
jgi:xylan 1,4-beta-xylosidase